MALPLESAHGLAREPIHTEAPVRHGRRLPVRIAPAQLNNAEPPADAQSAATLRVRAAEPLADRDEAVEMTIRAAEAARRLAFHQWGRWLTSVESQAEARTRLARAQEVYASRRSRGGVLRTDGDASRTLASDKTLTAREHEVLRLIAEGLSDREIAGRLVISPHTAHRHASNIRTKLGQPSRAAAVAYAVRHNLM